MQSFGHPILNETQGLLKIHQALEDFIQSLVVAPDVIKNEDFELWTA